MLDIVEFCVSNDVKVEFRIFEEDVWIKEHIVVTMCKYNERNVGYKVTQVFGLYEPRLKDPLFILNAMLAKLVHNMNAGDANA